MAEQLEKNGALFYRSAAKKIPDKPISQLLHDLAIWEEKHKEIFARMRTSLKGKGKNAKSIATDDKSSFYLQMLSGGNLFDLQSDSLEQIHPGMTIDEILQMAIKKEKDSVIFYLSLKHLLAKKADQKIIDAIIDDEMDHITFLNRELTTMHHQMM